MSQLEHDLELSMPQLGHNLVSYQWLLLGHDLQLIPLEQGHNYSLTVNKAESLYQLYQVKVHRRNYNSYIVIYIT